MMDYPGSMLDFIIFINALGIAGWCVGVAIKAMADIWTGKER
jgi:hypothetical protein